MSDRTKIASDQIPANFTVRYGQTYRVLADGNTYMPFRYWGHDPKQTNATYVRSDKDRERPDTCQLHRKIRPDIPSLSRRQYLHAVQVLGPRPQADKRDICQIGQRSRATRYLPTSP